MRQSKKLTYYNKRRVSDAGLDPADWRLIQETKDKIVIIHKDTGETKEIQKG